jgi:hypothetical protein
VISNLSAMQASALAIPPTYAIFLLMQLAELHAPSVSGFLTPLLTLVYTRLVRQDEVYRNSFLLTFPVAVITSALFLFLFNGDTGKYTVPLSFLMMHIQCCSRWFIYPSPRPNPVKFVFSFIPLSSVYIILAFLPPYAVALPGKLLANHPNAYTAWCGVGYPIFSFLLRKAVLNYFISYSRAYQK